jgi:pimeloyl-ACP methyl ester carboxylesterase
MLSARTCAKTAVATLIAASSVFGCASGERGPGDPTATSPSSASVSDATRARGMRETPVSFRDGANALHGVLVEPSGEGPFPVAVFVHGDGPATREGWGLYPPLWKALAEIGVASFSYDRPGTGESTGDWRLQSFADRAAELQSARHFLARHDRIDSGRIGFWGISQAGWIIPLVAGPDQGGAGFIICVSCPGGTVDQQGRYLLRRNLELEGMASTAVEQALSVYDAESAVQRHRNDGEWLSRYVDIREKYAREPWMKTAAATALLPQEPRTFGPDWDLDPRPLLRRVECPVLAIYGDLDSQVDPKDGASVYGGLAKEGKARPVRVARIAGANHAMLKARTGSLKEMVGFLGVQPLPYADDYIRTMQTWLVAVGVARPHR